MFKEAKAALCVAIRNVVSWIYIECDQKNGLGSQSAPTRQDLLFLLLMKTVSEIKVYVWYTQHQLLTRLKSHSSHIVHKDFCFLEWVFILRRDLAMEPWLWFSCLSFLPVKIWVNKHHIWLLQWFLNTLSWTFPNVVNSLTYSSSCIDEQCWLSRSLTKNIFLKWF